jgi:hypothetical protein
MSKRWEVSSSGSLLSAMADWFKITVDRYWRFADGIVRRSQIVGCEDKFEIARPTNASKTVQVDLTRGLEEFKDFIKVLRVGDRVRAFCDDGIIEAEKISPTRFKVIYAVETTESNPMMVV